MVELVSSNSSEDLEKVRKRQATEQAAQLVDQALRELTANLIRIARGAGKSYEIVRQVTELLNRMVAYHEAAGHGVSSWDLDRMLNWRKRPEWIARISQHERVIMYAEERMVAGALQIVASKLLEQRTQERAGHSEMYDGVRDLEGARAASRKKWSLSQEPKPSRKARRRKKLGS